MQKYIEYTADDDDADALSLDSSTGSSKEMKLSACSTSEATSCPTSGLASSATKPHAPFSDQRWDAIRRVQSVTATLGLYDLRFIQKLGSGDIGSVYLVELRGAEGCLFAAKVMDKEEMVSRSKEGRAGIEREILEMLDHPFLPTLYATVESDRWSCLLTEFCPGGDLHVLRQQQPERRFNEAAVRFYASEIVVALEYLHMMGIVYRDLKPENVLVRSDGHIMLTDFDLCLICESSTSAAQVLDNQNRNLPIAHPPDVCLTKPHPFSSCIPPNCFVPSVSTSCFHTRRKRRRRRRGAIELVAEPTDARSMSFVGTHEYLAPEIVSGEGHGSGVDWWTLGIFIFELFYGVTPFRGKENEFTLANIVARALEFPREPAISGAAKDLIQQLLIKEATRRMGSTMGATAIKHHQFFDGVKWALLRCTTPPYTPRPIPSADYAARDDDTCDAHVEYY
ncbi:hypothetical protein RJ640_014179 [Escallonia rubra]|uniref:non-specific serine/threonine protein kinase n=1 Tax=Escallonia rubra TaxID=112253 RepID=A0AA88UAB2_9ASTE|nr:hypothetical protein RJ640_014179 [Escallonia rubra]